MSSGNNILKQASGIWRVGSCDESACYDHSEWWGETWGWGSKTSASCTFYSHSPPPPPLFSISIVNCYAILWNVSPFLPVPATSGTPLPTLSPFASSTPPAPYSPGLPPPPPFSPSTDWPHVIKYPVEPWGLWACFETSAVKIPYFVFEWDSL